MRTSTQNSKRSVSPGVAPTPAPGHEWVCFDLDGTLAEDTWPNPNIGAPIPAMLNLLREYADQGYAIVIFTARPASHRDRIWEWVHYNDLGAMVYNVVTDKPLAGIYVDDRGYNPWA